MYHTIITEISDCIFVFSYCIPLCFLTYNYYKNILLFNTAFSVYWISVYDCIVTETSSATCFGHVSHHQITKHYMSSIICLMLLHCYYNKTTFLFHELFTMGLIVNKCSSYVISNLCSGLKNLVIQNKVITKWLYNRTLCVMHNFVA